VGKIVAGKINISSVHGLSVILPNCCYAL